VNVEEIKKLIELMNESDLIEMEIEEEGRKVRLCKASSSPEVVAFPTGHYPGPLPGAMLPGTSESPSSNDLERAGVREINSPMVGTFYRSSSPEAEPYVSIGDEISETHVVCIIEAMKVMNEIQAEIAGSIVDILVENGEAIEFGQPLFLVRPSGEGSE
jgi:acetyl-CoA carboxylase biotin carboxyl carrier protein